jgi:hypothetical protein
MKRTANLVGFAFAAPKGVGSSCGFLREADGLTRAALSTGERAKSKFYHFLRSTATIPAPVRQK